MFHFREHTEHDIKGILALFQTSFQKEASEEWLRWKYQRSPWGSKGYVVADGDTVVAFYGGIRLQFIFNGKTLWSYQFCDVMTHQKYRGRIVSKTPLIVRLGELFYRDNEMDFAYGFPSLRHARLQSLRLGGEGYRLVRVYKKEALRRYPLRWKLKVKEGWEYVQKEVLDRFSDYFKGRTSSRSDQEYKSIPLQLVKNEGYMTWRYRKHPLKTYGVFVFQRMKRTRGYVIFTVEENRFHALEVMHERETDVYDVLLALEDYISRNMGFIESIHMWFHPNEQSIESLDRLGYSSEDGIPVAFSSVNKDCGVTSDVFYGNYFYRMGDYDAT
jgi:hypothetical protein